MTTLIKRAAAALALLGLTMTALPSAAFAWDGRGGRDYHDHDGDGRDFRHDGWRGDRGYYRDYRGGYYDGYRRGYYGSRYYDDGYDGYYRERHHGNGGAVALGVGLGILGLAAVAAANSHHDKDRDGDYDHADRAWVDPDQR